jgi:xanthine dehydrogenase molybdopterin-binding subunit B
MGQGVNTKIAQSPRDFSLPLSVESFTRRTLAIANTSPTAASAAQIERPRRKSPAKRFCSV